ncbi:hypothetical protein Tco_0659411 [Tanacetum coccineum]
MSVLHQPKKDSVRLDKEGHLFKLLDNSKRLRNIACPGIKERCPQGIPTSKAKARRRSSLSFPRCQEQYFQTVLQVILRWITWLEVGNTPTSSRTVNYLNKLAPIRWDACDLIFQEMTSPQEARSGRSRRPRWNSPLTKEHIEEAHIRH